MATSNRFTKCKDPNDVDVELKTLLCCEYLHEKSCRDNFTKFKLKCRKHLTTTAEKQLSNPEDILEKLRAKGIIRISDYGELKNLVEDIDVDIVALIKEAEERIKNLEEQSDSPKSKRMKIDDVSSKDDVESINNLRQRLIKINNDDGSHSDSEELDKWEKKLKEFEFVFLLQLGDFQDVQTNIASVIDMICHVVFESDTDHHATIRHVLSSNKYRSLIIIDGLDEWNPNEETRKHLIYDRMPKLDVSSTVSCFIAMRPWVLSTMSKTVRNSDRVIEVFGLNEAGIENVIKNVLLNRYKLKDDPTKCAEEYAKIFRHFSEKKLKSFMQIPLLTVVCAQMLYEKKMLGDSLTIFYAEMLNMLIERANEKHKKLQIGHGATLGGELPEVLSKHKAIKNCTSILVKLGKLAYAGILSNETNITLQKIDLEEQIIEREFLLNVGFISQKEASSRTKKKVFSFSINLYKSSWLQPIL